MPPDEELRADSPKRWLKNALSDLTIARLPLTEHVLYEHLCFHAQQAAEKSLKAVLLQSGIEFPFTHDLEKLFHLLSQHLLVPAHLRDAVDLTPYAITRYPAEVEPVTHEEHEEAVRLAEAVHRWAEGIITRDK